MRDFEATGNELYAWEGIGVWLLSSRSTLDASLALPRELAQYLDECVKALLRSADAREREGPGSIGKALGFEHGLATMRARWGGPFDARERQALDVVERWYWEGHRTLGGACAAVDKKKARSLRRYVEDCDKYAKRAMQDRLRVNGVPVPSERSELLRSYGELCRRHADERAPRIVPSGPHSGRRIASQLGGP